MRKLFGLNNDDEFAIAVSVSCGGFMVANWPGKFYYIKKELDWTVYNSFHCLKSNGLTFVGGGSYKSNLSGNRRHL